MLIYGESTSTTSYVLLIMMNMLSTSNFEYEREAGSMILKYCFLRTQLHTRLTEFLLFSSALSCPFIDLYRQSNESPRSRTFVYSPSRERYCIFVCVHIVVCAFAYLSIPFFLMLVIVGLLGTCSMYLLVCICVVC